MLGIIVASIMLAFRVPLNSALLAFIGFQLFDVSLNLSYFRVKDKRRAKAMSDMIAGFAEGFGKEQRHVERRENSEKSDN
jgi:hypothetical protein